MSNEQEAVTMTSYLKGLDEEQLDHLLNEVLVEYRRRESDKIKKDVLTHSQSLRLRRVTPTE